MDFNNGKNHWIRASAESEDLSVPELKTWQFTKGVDTFFLVQTHIFS